MSKDEHREERVNAADVGCERHEVFDKSVVIRNESSWSRGFAYGGTLSTLQMMCSIPCPT